MTNGERIRKMNDEELADYVYSVFLAGKLTMLNIKHPIEEPSDYKEWLKEECDG